MFLFLFFFLFREFYDILSLDPEFLAQAKDESMDVSVFAPSEGFLNAIGLEKMKEIKNDFQVIRKVSDLLYKILAKYDRQFWYESFAGFNEFFYTDD